MSGPQSRSGRYGEIGGALILPGLELRPLSSPSHSQSLYRLSYYDSEVVQEPPDNSCTAWARGMRQDVRAIRTTRLRDRGVADRANLRTPRAQEMTDIVHYHANVPSPKSSNLTLEPTVSCERHMRGI
jgi:hypothetical protein